MSKSLKRVRAVLEAAGLMPDRREMGETRHVLATCTGPTAPAHLHRPTCTGPGGALPLLAFGQFTPEY